MAGYTYASGVMTATVTARCPICHAVRAATWEDRMGATGAVNPCCSPAHEAAYLARLRQVTRAFCHTHGHKGVPRRGYAGIRRDRSLATDTAEYVVKNAIPFHTEGS